MFARLRVQVGYGSTLPVLSVIPINRVPPVVLKITLNPVEIVLSIFRVDTVNRSFGFS
jgi:hypothetical protein